MKLLPFESQYKFRFSLRRLMAVVAIYAILLAMFVPTVRLRVDWEKPRLDDLVFTGSLMVAEAGLVYYAVLAAVIAGGVLNSPKRVGNVSTLLIYGPVLATIACIALLQTLDACISR
jgi:hypothetical protein